MLPRAMFDPIDEARIAKAVCRAFATSMPRDIRTHCVLCSQVVSACLNELGLSNRIAPCQLLYSSQGQAVLLGFTGTAQVGKWDGHAVVRWRDLLFDCATGSFKRDFGFDVPSVIVAPCVNLPSNMKANVVAGGAVLCWLRPPIGADTTLPIVDTEAIAEYSELLFTNTRQLLSSLH